MTTEELLMKMYEDIKTIKKVNEIRIALIPEDEPAEEELREIELGKKEIAEKKYRPWKEIKNSMVEIFNTWSRKGIEVTGCKSKSSCHF